MEYAATEYKPLTLDGETIRQLRHEAGLTQRALAQRLDVTPETVANWENGRSSPRSAELAIKIVKVLDPHPEPSERTMLLPPSVFTVADDRTLAAIKKTGKPPRVYFTKVYPVLEL